MPRYMHSVARQKNIMPPALRTLRTYLLTFPKREAGMVISYVYVWSGSVEPTWPPAKFSSPQDNLKPACLGGAVDIVAVRAAWLRWSASLSSRPRLAESLCQVIAAYALRLNSRAGTEGSTVSSLICDCWLILGSETLSISRCLNHW